MSDNNQVMQTGGLFIVDMYIDELVRTYRVGAIFKWSALPFSIRKNVVRSNKYHNEGNRNWATGAFSETHWTMNNPNNQPCDVIVDEFFHQMCPNEESVIIVFGDQDYEELIEFVLDAT